MELGARGMVSEVPELAEFIARETQCDIPKLGYYIELTRNGERVACLIFYSPRTVGERLVLKFGAAMVAGTWGAQLNEIAWVWDLIKRVVFGAFGADELEADVRVSNMRAIRALGSANFRRCDPFMYHGDRCVTYKLERPHGHE